MADNNTNIAINALTGLAGNMASSVRIPGADMIPQLGQINDQIQSTVQSGMQHIESGLVHAAQDRSSLIGQFFNFIGELMGKAQSLMAKAFGGSITPPVEQAASPTAHAAAPANEGPSGAPFTPSAPKIQRGWSIG